MKKLNPVSIKAYVAIPASATGHHVARLHKRIPWPWNRCSAKIQRHTLRVADDFNHIRISEVFYIDNVLAQRGDAGMRVGAQISRDLINNLGRNQGFIALHIDNNMVVSQTQFRHDFLQPVCAGRVLYRRHAHLSTKGLSDLYYTAIIGCNHDPLGPT